MIPLKAQLLLRTIKLPDVDSGGNHWESNPPKPDLLAAVETNFLRATDQFWLNMAVSVGLTDASYPLSAI
jgi:hypothetical protein